MAAFAPFWLQKTWPLIAVCGVPLAATSAKHEKALFMLGTGLTVLLSKLTYVQPADGTSLAAADEKAALDGVLLTSAGNRLVRLAHGACFLLAALQFTRRWAASTRDAEANTAAQEQRSLAASAAWTALGWAGTLALCYIGSKMFSTGYHGQ